MRNQNLFLVLQTEANLVHFKTSDAETALKIIKDKNPFMSLFYLNLL